MSRNPVVALLTASSMMATGCARDVVIKPAVIEFNADARASVTAARKQYDDTIVRLNNQLADFLARHPECGLRLTILPRKGNLPPDNSGRYCVTQAEKDALKGNIKTEDLTIASRNTFAAQFEALRLLLDYVGFLAEHADDPKLTAKSEITATAGAVGSLGKGVSDLNVAFGGKALKEFEAGGPVAKFAKALGDLADTLENIARQADDVNALEGAIKTGQPRVEAAITLLADSADAWTCAAIERGQISTNDFALTQSAKLPTMTEDARRAAAREWINQVALTTPDYCPGDDKDPKTGGSPVARSAVAEMMLAVKQANAELVDIANHKYTPAQRKAIIDATLSRLGGVLSRAAGVLSIVL